MARTLGGKGGPLDGIQGSQLVTAIFGQWPSFHDSEVVSITIARSEPYDAGPTLEAEIHVFEMTSEVTPSGYYVLRNHTLVTLRFSGITSLELVDFNNQNVLMGLQIEDIRSHQLEGLPWRVSLDPSFGVSARFLCHAIEVRSAKPWTPPPRPFAA
jgi:hypothetical protein